VVGASSNLIRPASAGVSAAASAGAFVGLVGASNIVEATTLIASALLKQAALANILVGAVAAANAVSKQAASAGISEAATVAAFASVKMPAFVGIPSVATVGADAIVVTHSAVSPNDATDVVSVDSALAVGHSSIAPLDISDVVVVDLPIAVSHPFANVVDQVLIVQAEPSPFKGGLTTIVKSPGVFHGRGAIPRNIEAQRTQSRRRDLPAIPRWD